MRSDCYNTLYGDTRVFYLISREISAVPGYVKGQGQGHQKHEIHWLSRNFWTGCRRDFWLVAFCSLCLGHMGITGSPGSYGPVRLWNPYERAIRGMPVRNWTSCDVLVTCKRVRVFYGISTVSLRCFGEGVARTCTVTIGYHVLHVRVRTVHVRAPYGPVRAWEHPYNYTIIVRDPCGSRWWPWVHIRVIGPVRFPTCLLRGKKMCMYNFQTRAAYGYTGSIRAEKTRTTPCGPARYAVRSPTGHWSLDILWMVFVYQQNCYAHYNISKSGTLIWIPFKNIFSIIWNIQSWKLNDINNQWHAVNFCIINSKRIYCCE